MPLHYEMLRCARVLRHAVGVIQNDIYHYYAISDCHYTWSVTASHSHCQTLRYATLLIDIEFATPLCMRRTPYVYFGQLITPRYGNTHYEPLADI